MGLNWSLQLFARKMTNVRLLFIALLLSTNHFSPPNIFPPSTVSLKMSEEEIMRKRLTLEGDGGSDDKRIMSLVKTFVRWSQLTGLSEEDVDATYQKMLFTLGM